MNNIEKYIDFLDNKLDTGDEQKFAELFAVDTSFRDNFKRYLLLSSSLKESSDYFTPTSQSKAAVFGKLGLSSGIVEPVTPLIKQPAFMKSKLFSMLASSVISVLLTLCLMNLFDTKKGIENIADKYTPSNANLMSQNLTANSQEKKQPLDKSQNPAFQFKKVIKFDNTARPLQIIDNSVSDDPSAENSDPANIELSQLSKADSKELLGNISPVQQKNELLDDITHYDTILLIRSYDKKFRFEFKNTPSWFSNDPAVQPNQLNRFNNLSISAYLPVFQSILLGLDYRQETFSVEYNGINNSGKLTNYFMQPNLTTLSFVLRWTPFNISEKIKPFFQGSLGGNLSGVVSREMFGMEVYPFDNVYMLMGLEYNQFYFTHKNVWFDANKISLNFGLGLKF